jgi:GNAT superfamily N-acetyltransferase
MSFHVVAADRRGERIGRRLVERVARWALERGLEQISVRSNIAGTESHCFTNERDTFA